MFKKCAKRNKILFHFMAPFLAMAKLKQAWLCSSGLTKTLLKLRKDI